jgi:hypothetical protein
MTLSLPAYRFMLRSNLAILFTQMFVVIIRASTHSGRLFAMTPEVFMMAL